MKFTPIAISSFIIGSFLVASPYINSADAFAPHLNTVNIGSIKRSTQLYKSTLDKTEEEKSTRKEKPLDAPSVKEPIVEENALSLSARLATSGAISLATAAVNTAVSMKSLEAPTASKSYIALDRSNTEIDEDGLPLVYDADMISQYWKKERGALNARWSFFLGKAVPFLTKLVTLFISEGEIGEQHIPSLARQARMDIQDLGPTFIKLGQVMSVRPDVLPQSALEELAVLQDSVIPFETSVAVEQIEKELGGKLGEFFLEISEEPVAAASLAQVYLATLLDGRRVAVKVQRPDMMGTVSKDLYVLRRASEVVQGLVDRFAPQQKTNYVGLFNEWAIGFYTELDFLNEGKNQMRLREELMNAGVKNVMVPKIHQELCTRKILVSDWVDGVKLSECSQEVIGEVTPFAQEAFLVQLFESGFFHADPHPGNILKMDELGPDGKHQIALIDCGLMAQINQGDRDNMISAVIHLANKDYASLVDDFILLKILPEDSDRKAIIPLMDKALSPYVKGGGAKKYEEELKKLYGMEDGDMKSTVGGFQAMTQDALTVLNDIPFSIPPYFAILGRAIVTLEGVALTGNPDYGIILESYPFLARKLLREDRPEIQRALQEVLFSSSGENTTGKLKFTRLLALLNNAALTDTDRTAGTTSTDGAFVDLDAIPEDGIDFKQGLKYLLSDKAESLRNLLLDQGEVDSIVDVLTRQVIRKGVNEALLALSPPKFLRIPAFLPSPPKLEDIPLPMLLPSLNGGDARTTPSVGVLSIKQFQDMVAPKLNQDEEIYAIGLSEAAAEFFGPDLQELVRGEGVFTVKSGKMLLDALRSGALGPQSLRDSGTAKSILDGLGTVLHSLPGGNSDGIDDRSSLDSILDAVNDLDGKEKARLDDILEELAERGLERTSERLVKVDRII